MTDIEQAYNFLKKRETLRMREKQSSRVHMLKMLRHVLSALSDDYEYTKAYLFGSWNKGSQSEHSDIDLALAGDIDFFQIARLQAEFEKRLQRNADIRMLHELPFKDVVIKEGAIVYDRKNQTA